MNDDAILLCAKTIEKRRRQERRDTVESEKRRKLDARPEYLKVRDALAESIKRDLLVLVDEIDDDCVSVYTAPLRRVYRNVLPIESCMHKLGWVPDVLPFVNNDDPSANFTDVYHTLISRDLSNKQQRELLAHPTVDDSYWDEYRRCVVITAKRTYARYFIDHGIGAIAKLCEHFGDRMRRESSGEVCKEVRNWAADQCHSIAKHNDIELAAKFMRQSMLYTDACHDLLDSAIERDRVELVGLLLIRYRLDPNGGEIMWDNDPVYYLPLEKAVRLCRYDIIRVFRQRGAWTNIMVGGRDRRDDAVLLKDYVESCDDLRLKREFADVFDVDGDE